MVLPWHLFALMRAYRARLLNSAQGQTCFVCLSKPTAGIQARSSFGQQAERMASSGLIEDDQKGLEVAEAALNECTPQLSLFFFLGGGSAQKRTRFRDQHYKRGEAIALDQIGSVLYGMRRPQEALMPRMPRMARTARMGDGLWCFPPEALEAATEALDLIKSLEELPKLKGLAWRDTG